TLETVRAACAEHQVLSVVYNSSNSGDERRRRLGPHGLYFAQGSLYLLAEDLEAQQESPKVFSVSRMREAEMLDEEYNATPLDPETYFKDTFGIFKAGTPVTVRIEVHHPIANYVRERSWHESQKVIGKTKG